MGKFALIFFSALFVSVPAFAAPGKKPARPEETCSVSVATSSITHYRVVGDVERLEPVPPILSGTVAFVLVPMSYGETIAAVAKRVRSRGLVMAHEGHLEVFRMTCPNLCVGKRIFVELYTGNSLSYEQDVHGGETYALQGVRGGNDYLLMLRE